MQIRKEVLMKNNKNTVQIIKYIGGMALCVILSVLILVFGEHNSDVAEDVGKVDMAYEMQDGDLDFGQTADGQVKQATPTPVPTATPTPDAENDGDDGHQGSGTVDDPLLLFDNSFSYQVVDGKATVTEVLSTDAEELVIPAKIEGYPVTIIGEYLCQGMAKLKKVSLPEGLTEIAGYAFENCVSLEEIAFPSTLTTIRDSAFFSCNSLTGIAIPEKTKTIEDYAFYACDNLTELSLYQTSGLDMIFDMSIVTKVTVGEGVSYIAESAFEYCGALTEVKLPSTLTSIKAYAFYGCTVLECLHLPEGLVSISEDAFENCNSLKEINLPDSLMLIAEYAFFSCEALESLVIPDEIASIGYGAFDGCENLVLLVGAESVGEEYATANDLLYELK